MPEGRLQVIPGITALDQRIDEAFGNEEAALLDRSQLAGWAHVLVAQAALFGFHELSRICRELENVCGKPFIH
jgi:HPt (histidine-containing phosphotransfer) domain-containing protein